MTSEMDIAGPMQTDCLWISFRSVDLDLIGVTRLAPFFLTLFYSPSLAPHTLCLYLSLTLFLSLFSFFSPSLNCFTFFSLFHFSRFFFFFSLLCFLVSFHHVCFPTASNLSCSVSLSLYLRFRSSPSLFLSIDLSS